MVLLGELSGGIMRDEMGTLRVDVQIENPARPGEKRTLNAVLVDTGAELSWVPAPVLESLGVDRNARRTGASSSDGPARWWSPSAADESGTKSSSGSRAISCCWARAPWKGSISVWNPSRSSWWTPAPRPLRQQRSL